MSEDPRTARNRRITGVLLGMRSTPPGEYDFERLFDDGIEDFLQTPNAAAFAMLLAAQWIGEAARIQRGLGPSDFVGLGLPAAAEKDPDIVAAFRIVTTVMNRDVGTAQALVETVTRSRSRSRNVLACLFGMLMEAPPPVSGRDHHHDPRPDPVGR